jgi:hypothetical protein
MSPDLGDENAPQPDGSQTGFSRRNFLRRGTFTAAAIAVAGSVPGLSALVASTTAEAPAVDVGVSDAADDSGALTEPLVAQVKDLNTGEISLFQGEQEVIVKSPALARSLMSAARR